MGIGQIFDRLNGTPPAKLHVAEQAAVGPHPDPDSRQKYEALHELEKGISAHRRSWIVAGRALREINELGLYRCHSPSFEEYLKRRWGLSRRHGLDLITGAGVADNVREIRHYLSLRAALKLAKLPSAELQQQCLTEAIAGCGSKSPPASYMAVAVAAHLPAKADRSNNRKRPKPVRLRSDLGTLSFDGRELRFRAKRASSDLVALLRDLLAEAVATQPQP